MRTSSIQARFRDAGEHTKVKAAKWPRSHDLGQRACDSRTRFPQGKQTKPRSITASVKSCTDFPTVRYWECRSLACNSCLVRRRVAAEALIGRLKLFQPKMLARYWAFQATRPLNKQFRPRTSCWGRLAAMAKGNSWYTLHATSAERTC